jgi:hypothetical protein
VESFNPLRVVITSTEVGVADYKMWATHGQETIMSGKQHDWRNDVHVMWHERRHSGTCQTCGWRRVE